MQVSPHVRAVQVPDDNPMHPLYTNIFLVGERRLLAIDSGEALDRYKWAPRSRRSRSPITTSTTAAT
jgi:hypothetical protein